MSEHSKPDLARKDNQNIHSSSENHQANTWEKALTPPPSRTDSVQTKQIENQEPPTASEGESSVYFQPNIIQRLQALPEDEKPDYFKPNIIQRMQADPNNTYFQPNIIQKMQALPDSEKPAYFQPNIIQRLQALPENERPESLQPNLIQRLQRKQAEEDEAAKLNTEPSKKMPDAVQAKMENSFNTDFSNVNIHEGNNASKVNAHAYTQGSDIHFASGQYNPESKQGQELLGHELTHVVQQREGRVQPTVQKKGVAVNDDKGLEKEADDAGKMAAEGKEVHVKEKDKGLQQKETFDDKKSKALSLINEFETKMGISTVSWNNISSKDFAFALKEMVNEPRSVNQKDTNLCGIAVTCKAMIHYDPGNFVKMAISLYEKGSADSNSFLHSNMSSNDDLHSKKPTNGLSAASYVIMTSMRHTYNLGFSYDPITDTGLDGLTYPGDLSDIATNFSNIKDVTWEYAHNVEGLNTALADNAFIIGLFDMDKLKSGTDNIDILKSTFGEHYIQINTIIKQGDNVVVNYWNWGDTSKQQTTITTSLTNFAESVKNYTILNSNEK